MILKTILNLPKVNIQILSHQKNQGQLLDSNLPNSLIAHSLKPVHNQSIAKVQGCQGRSLVRFDTIPLIRSEAILRCNISHRFSCQPICTDRCRCTCSTRHGIANEDENIYFRNTSSRNLLFKFPAAQKCNPYLLVQ